MSREAELVEALLWLAVACAMAMGAVVGVLVGAMAGVGCGP
jgi:hypothetical protein